MSKAVTHNRESEAAASAEERRFAFGKNWQRFLTYLNDDRIVEAEISLCEMLGVGDLKGKSFIDIGSGSGLFSLAAIRLGATKVHSFDYDPQSVACAQELKRRFFPNAANWTIERASALDQNYLAQLGQFDVVYSWGVLHHTGNMWQALDNAGSVVALQGVLFLAVYNEQRFYSGIWKAIKKLYNKSRIWRPFLLAGVGLYFGLGGLAVDIFLLRRNPLNRYRYFHKLRGMSYLTDLIDWVGGYPFEVAKPDAVFRFFSARGFRLMNLKTVGGALGCNEFVMVKCRET